MKQGSVKKRIFISNAFMVLVSLLVFLAINLVIIKGYSEAIEKEIRTSVEQIVDEDGLEDLIIDWTFQRNEFLLFFGLDGILCIIVLVIISQISVSYTHLDDVSEIYLAMLDGWLHHLRTGQRYDVEYYEQCEDCLLYTSFIQPACGF